MPLWEKKIEYSQSNHRQWQSIIKGQRIILILLHCGLIFGLISLRALAPHNSHRCTLVSPTLHNLTVDIFPHHGGRQDEKAVKTIPAGHFPHPKVSDAYVSVDD